MGSPFSLITSMGSNSSWTSALLALSLTELEVLGSDIPQFGKRGGVEDDFTDTDTRNQMLEASRELHKYFHDCKDVLSRILEKQNSMSDELGRDGATVSMLQRKHQNFLQDLSTLQSQVTAIQEESAKLQAAYAGDKAMEITNREREVVRAWMDLQGCGDSRKNKLNDTGNLFRFFAMVRNLMLWMDDLMRQVHKRQFYLILV